MNERPTRLRTTRICEILKASRALSICATLVASLVLLSVLTLARDSFTDYNDVQQVLAFLTDALPPELKSSDSAAQRKAWPDWVIAHDRDTRRRLLRGDEDTIANWLMFGTSFTQQPKALFEVSLTSDTMARVISGRIEDFISALGSPDPNERSVFARRVLLSQGYRFGTIEERARLERHLLEEVERIIAERQKYTLRVKEAGDVVEKTMVQARMYRDRGLSLDTSILPGFAVEQALETMKDQGLLLSNSIRRVAVIGPGLDFADKNSGYDFYPAQTLQPFTSIDSLVRLGLATGPAEVAITTLDISPRVNDHIMAIQDLAKTGTPYILRLPIDLVTQWTPELLSYWKSIGDRIGSEMPLPKPPGIGKELELRGVEVPSQVVARITPVDFNVVTERWTGPPFDLVIATNVLVYYDRFEQSLAFAGIEAMLRPGGFFITNNVIVELPTSHLRSRGVITVRHFPKNVDHVYWYRRNEP